MLGECEVNREWVALLPYVGLATEYKIGRMLSLSRSIAQCAARSHLDGCEYTVW